MNCTRTRARRQWKFLPPNIAIFAPNTQGMRACEAHFVPNTQDAQAGRSFTAKETRATPLEQNARKNDKQDQGQRRRRSSAAAAQLVVRRNAKTKALQQSAPQGSQFIEQQQKARSDRRRRPSLLTSACIPGWQFRRSRSFPYRPSARPRLPSFAPSRLHSPCRHTSYGRRRWSPCRARSRYRPRTAR